MIANALLYSPADAGLVLAVLAPLTAYVNLTDPRASPRYTLSGPSPLGDGVASLVVDTEYPFGDTVTLTLTGAPAGTPLYVRIPSWATGATVSVNGGAAAPRQRNREQLAALVVMHAESCGQGDIAPQQQTQTLGRAVLHHGFAEKPVGVVEHLG